MSWIAYVARIAEKRNTYRVLMGKSEGKRLLGTLISIMEDNIKLDLQEMQYDIWCGLYASGSDYEQLAICYEHLFLSFRRVLNVNYSFLGNSPASEF